MLNPLLDDRYQILALIGEGGMGRVYRAEQVRVGREVAVKLIREDRPIDARAYRQFVEEARACSALQHPNVVTVHDFGQTAEGTLYLVMELLQGQLLSSAIRSGEVSLQRAVTIASQICAGLSAAHAIGIVHQDLKPSNVMLCSPDGVGELAKILDFGIAGLVNQPRPDRAVRGSPPYMSPEQIRGGRVDSRSDIYAVGATLFEMFTGRPPFEGSVEDILAQHCEAPPPSLLGVVPVAVAQLVSACLAKLPEERPRSVGLLQEALASVRVEGQEAHPEIAAPTGAATATLGTLAEGEVSTTGSSWSAEVLGEALPGAPEMIVREVLEGLPSRSVMLAAADGATLRVRRMTLERPARRWEVELALERWFTPLSTLEHAAVAGWQRRWWDGDVLYLAGPPLEGEGLDVLLHRQGRLPPDQALFVAQGVCQGLTALHTLGVVHGDLRPGTVRVGEGTMLAEPGLWALVDHGAVALSAEARQEALRRKAPEQFRVLGKRAGLSVDLYAVGVLLYELLTGRTPFDQESPEALLEAKLAARYPPISQLVPRLPPGFDALVSRLLQPMAADRLRSVSALEKSLSALSREEQAEVSGRETSGRFRVLVARGRLLHRELETRALTEALEDGRAGHGRRVVLRGAEGVGRTRLLEWALIQAQRSGALVLRCRGLARYGGEPFRGARALLAGLDGALSLRPQSERAEALESIRVGAGDYGGTLRDFAPLLDELFQEQPMVLLGAGEAEVRDAAIRALQSLVLALARRPRWLVFAVDDLQWLDEATHRWLERFMLLLPRLPVVVLLTAREGYTSSLVSASGGTLLALEPLPVAAVELLLRERLSAPDRSGLVEVSESIHQLTGGYPAAIFSVLREGERGGVFSRSETGWQVDRAGLAALPPSRSVLERAVAELEALSPEHRAVLGAGAVWGQPFDVAVLRSLIDGPVIAALAAAERSGVLEEHTHDWWRFRHDALREVTEEQLSEEERTRLHRAAVGWLAATGLQEAVFIAEHLLQCPAGTGDVLWLRRATEAAIGGGDGTSAIRFAREALVRGGDDEQAVQTGELLLARALVCAQQLEHATALYERALAGDLELSQRTLVTQRLSRLYTEVGQADAALRIQEAAMRTLGWTPATRPLAVAMRGLRSVISELILRPRGALIEHPVAAGAAESAVSSALGELLTQRGVTFYGIDQRASLLSSLEGLTYMRRGTLRQYSQGLSGFVIVATQGLGWQAGAARLARYALASAERSGDAESRCLARVVELNRLLLLGKLKAMAALEAETSPMVYRQGRDSLVAMMEILGLQRALMQGRSEEVVEIAMRLHDYQLHLPDDREPPWAAVAALACMGALGEGERALVLLDRISEMSSLLQRPLMVSRLKVFRLMALLNAGRVEECLLASQALRAPGAVPVGRWYRAALVVSICMRMVDVATSPSPPAEAGRLLAEVRAILRWTRLAARAYPIARLSTAYLQARLSLAEGQVGRAQRQLRRLVPAARAQRSDGGTLLSLLILAMAGSMAGGTRSPEGRVLIDEARALLADISPAHLIVRPASMLCELEPPAADTAALLSRLSPILDG